MNSNSGYGEKIEIEFRRIPIDVLRKQNSREIKDFCIYVIEIAGSLGAKKYTKYCCKRDGDEKCPFAVYQPVHSSGTVVTNKDRRLEAFRAYIYSPEKMKKCQDNDTAALAIRTRLRNEPLNSRIFVEDSDGRINLYLADVLNSPRSVAHSYFSKSTKTDAGRKLNFMRGRTKRGI
ncbi:MAG: hypothetical protein HZB65_01295 [Candidatus Aenigmarchaeota archaeon]|nr:hypothetical protein [Candidatus Aenigmarchaeota archaeon]